MNMRKNGYTIPYHSPPPPPLLFTLIINRVKKIIAVQGNLEDSQSYFNPCVLYQYVVTNCICNFFENYNDYIKDL